MVLSSGSKCVLGFLISEPQSDKLGPLFININHHQHNWYVNLNISQRNQTRIK